MDASKKDLTEEQAALAQRVFDALVARFGGQEKAAEVLGVNQSQVSRGRKGRTSVALLLRAAMVLSWDSGRPARLGRS